MEDTYPGQCAMVEVEFHGEQRCLAAVKSILAKMTLCLEWADRIIPVGRAAAGANGA